MRLLVLVSLMLALWTAPAPAQETAQDDRGYVQAFLEDNLSAAGREVRIEGFEGALSSRLSIDQLSIADDSGQWIVLRDVTLDWTRSALLSGRVQVDTLRAGEIRLERLPGTSEDISVEDSAAQPFALPELPVSIEIGTLDAPRVTLGPAVLGQRADLAVAGGLSLVGGQGKARLDIKRTDRDDAFKLRAAYDNETRVLSLDADLREAEDGLIGTLLNLPDRPSLALRAAGEGPLSDFTASISLATGGQDRLAGDVTLRDTGEARDTPGTTFAAELSGDVAPLFQPEFRPFFGSRASLAIRGVRGADGSLRLSDVTLDAAALSLDGQLDLDPQGWPSRFALSGTLGGDGPVRLPMGGPETLIDSARIDARFDAARADGWTADITIARLVRDGLTVGAADLTARGRIDRAAPQGASAQLALTATGLDHHDTAIATALGPRLDARMQLDWQEGSPLWINDLRLTSGGTELHADARLQALADGLPMDGRAQLDTPDLARFAPLAGRELAGAADMTLEGRATLLSGAFDGQVRATTTDLATGTPRLDPLLAGETRLALKAARDETGTAIERLNLDNDAVDADISGRISPRDGQLDVVAALTDIALVEPRVAGPARLDTRVTWQAGGDVTISRLAATLAGAEIEADGRLDPEDPALPVQGGVTARIPDLSAFAALAGTPLKGSLSFSADGSGAIRAGRFDLRGDASGDSLATGIADLDKLIAGKLDMRFDAGRDNETLRLSLFEAETPMVRLSARSTAADSPVALSMRLADLGAFAPGLDGPLTAEGTLQPITPDARELDVDLAADGPGGMRIRAAGTIRDLGRQLDLSLSGALPLALVNRQLAPNSLRGTATYDLRLDGTPGLAALSGTARTEGARAALPALDTALEGIDATVTLGAQTARIELSGSPLDGGSFTLNGPVSLVPPHAADLAVALSGLTLTDRKVFTTTADGTLSVIGPLTGGARIGGRVTLGRADIRVPSGTAAEAVALPGL
uniref:DUF490 domain-containing protein n=1 Tax=Roseovarius halophilus (ex Wu et al. 2025) TaxID=3376060 RepID=UPI00399A86C5